MNDTSEELNQEKIKNKNLRKQLKLMKTPQNEEMENAITELQQENQRLSKEMQNAKRHHHHRQEKETPRPKKLQQVPDDDKNVDPSKVHLAGQLMAENALLRNTLGLDPLNYNPAESFNSLDIDIIIAQLLDHNKIMREQAAQQSHLQNGNSKRPKQTQQMARYLQYLDLQGSREGCTFWVPLDAKKQKEQQDYYNDMQMRLPISIEKKKKKTGCNKCEKAILMMSRVPPYPPDSRKIMEFSDEFQLIESWVVTSLNKKVRLVNIMKSSFYYKIIENERTMHNIRLVTVATNEAEQYLTNGFDKPILVADHFNYVAHEIKQSGSVQILICAFDEGNQATNYCEHTVLPNLNEIQSMNQAFDSLRFRYLDNEAIMAINFSRLVPLYFVQISESD